MKGHLLGQQRLISAPSLPSPSIPHLPGILSQPPTFQGTGEGGEEPWRGTDCPSSCGTSGTVLPLNLSVPVCRVGRMKAHFPRAYPLPQKSPVPAKCLATAIAHCPPHSSLCSAGHLDTQGDNNPDGKWGAPPLRSPCVDLDLLLTQTLLA